jgi:hypothetical protein
VRFRRRGAFGDVVERQLDLFSGEHADLLARCAAALRDYDAAPAEEAEERYGDYADLADEAREALEELRDAYAATLDADTAERYAAAFDTAAGERFPAYRPTG